MKIYRTDFEFDFKERSDDVLFKPIVRAIVWLILSSDFGLIFMAGYAGYRNLTENPDIKSTIQSIERILLFIGRRFAP